MKVGHCRRGGGKDRARRPRARSRLPRPPRRARRRHPAAAGPGHRAGRPQRQRQVDAAARARPAAPAGAGEPARRSATAADALALRRREFARQVTLLAQSRPTPTGLSRARRRRVRPAPVPRALARRRPRRPGGDRPRDGGHRRRRRWPTAPVDELSGGQLQRVWLASCLAQDTGVLLLDEPTTFLDLRYQVEILDLVRDLADAHGVAVGVVLHDLDQAAAVADELRAARRGPGPAPAGRRPTCSDAELLTEVYGIRGRGGPRPAHRRRRHPPGRPARARDPRPRHRRRHR